MFVYILAVIYCLAVYILAVVYILADKHLFIYLFLIYMIKVS